jgi:mannosyltransferase
VLGLATLLRLHGLATWPLEQDELYTIRDAVAFGQQIPWVRPFYYFLQHLLLQLFPPTPLFLRLPPFLFGVLGVWLTWELGRKVFGTTAGLVAGFLVAISPWHLYASQFARYWTLVYALSALLYLLLPRALDTDRPAIYLLSLSSLVVGALTHPTFVFPVVGVALAVLAVSRDGRLRWVWPSRRGWLFLWGPLCLMAAGGFLLLTVTGFPGSGRVRGPTALLRLIPAMVQWASPVVVAAAVLGAAFQLAGPLRADRRWGAMAALGCLGGVALLVAASFRRGVYADYAMAMLPLLYVTVGGVVQRISELLASQRRAFALGATLTLAAGVLPGTVSHLSDGTRFDYRAAYSYIERTGGDHPVVGWPEAVQRYYAPRLNYEPLRADPTYLSELLQRTSGFWLVASYRRRGMVHGNGRASRWIDARCRRVLETERPRLDYRTYRVGLHWCGPAPPPVPKVARR